MDDYQVDPLQLKNDENSLDNLKDFEKSNYERFDNKLKNSSKSKQVYPPKVSNIKNINLSNVSKGSKFSSNNKSNLNSLVNNSNNNILNNNNIKSSPLNEEVKIYYDKTYVPIDTNYNRNIDLDTSALKIRTSKLSNQKAILENDVKKLKENLKIVKSEEYKNKLAELEKKRHQEKSEAHIYLNMCSQLAEELIHLRSKLDTLLNEKKQQ